MTKVNPKALTDHHVEKANDADARQLVGCGQGRPSGSVRIVDAETRLQCPSGRVGEIWVRGGAVAGGYWQKPLETAEAFNASLADTGEGPFLRTGDLGFLDGSELFITGRLKDLIIIRGRNHYPQDIEQTALESHPALRPAGGAAFSVNGDGVERLVIVHEVERTQRNVEPQAVIDAIRENVARQHELQVSAVVLLKPGQIYKTSSGKIRRRACSQSFLANEFEALARWEQAVGPSPDLAPAPAESASSRRPLSAEQVQNLILEQLATALSIPVGDIDPTEPFARYGLDSAGAVSMAGNLESAIGQTLPVTLFYDYPNVRELACHLAGEPVSVATAA